MTPFLFSKMHGLGNDFVVIDATKRSIHFTTRDIVQLADRHNGIGFDQLLMVESARDNETDFFYRIYNNDGQEVAQCGNGARCIARFIADQNLSAKKQLRVATHKSQMTLILEDDDSVSVNMGVPQFAPSSIPLQATHEQLLYFIDWQEKEMQFVALSIGNPHAVIVVPDVYNAPVNEFGCWLAAQGVFPEGVNVSFAQIIDRNHFNLRVYERGAGETQACGSGAVATMIALHRLDMIANSATAHLPGGDLLIRWNGVGEPAWMRGPAVTVFVGEFILSPLQRERPPH